MSQLLETAVGPGAYWKSWHNEDEPIRLGVSSCVLGTKVRFDGGHKHSRFVTDVLGQWVSYVPVCPEVEAGLSIPRPSMRLVKESSDTRLVAPKTGEDFTDTLTNFSRSKVNDLMIEGLDGFILKKGSPSCGMERIPIYRNGQPFTRSASGIFAKELMEKWPQLPIEEDGRLNDPVLRENFIERVFCRHRWRLLVSQGATRRRLVAFHTAHKLLLLSHNESACRRLGRLLASAGRIPDSELFQRYEEGFQQCLKTKSTVKRHVNVLQHALGHFKTCLERRERHAIMSVIDDFSEGLLPLIVPVTVLRHVIHTHNVKWLVDQLYFSPHPKELMLRNHT